MNMKIAKEITGERAYEGCKGGSGVGKSHQS